jgi:hypothetical protein
MTWTNGWSSSNITYTSATTGTIPVMVPVATTPAKPKVPTPLEWLADEVDRICALTRGGLAIP